MKTPFLISGSRIKRLKFALSLAAAVLAGCSAGQELLQPEKTTIRIKGSDTMHQLATRWAEEFMKVHPAVAVYVTSGGTESGIRALIDGDVDMCTASRTLHADEARDLLKKQRSLGFSILTAKDALSVYLHPENPVKNLTLPQVRGLFSGEFAAWSDIGGEAVPVQVTGRPPNSGTYFFFEEHVLQGDTYASSTVTVPTTSLLVSMIRNNRGAIGYGGLAYGDDVTHASIDGVTPTAENVRNGSYPISRYLYLYAAAAPEGAIKQFVDWILSNSGQNIVREVGYIPLWETDEF
jgi:phosphate transport system substrate-binding protein